jgi:predicted lipase
MISNDLILKIAYLCKLSYKSQDEINEVFDKNEQPYCELIEKCKDKPLLYESKNRNDCEAYCVNYDNNLIIIFRGTESLRDVLSDINIVKEPLLLKNITKFPCVHNGFLKQLDSVTNNIEREISEFKRNEPSGSIILCGHSLGGAIATIAALKYTLKFEIPAYCITFGSPRAGDTRFCELFNEKIMLSIRIVNEDDPIPLVPLPIRYSHVEGIKWLYKNNIKTNSEQCCKWVRFIKNFFLSCSTCCLLSAFNDHTMDNYIEDLINIEDFVNSEVLSVDNESIEVEIN